jgi:tetratricopeptide (TPR) repeat protein
VAPAPSADDSAAAEAAPEPERPRRDPQDVRKARKKRKRAQSMRSRAGNEMLQKLRERLKKARRYYIVAQKDYEEGRVVKAASAMHLAVQHDPKNEEYKELFARYQEESKDAQAAKFVVVAEQAESFHRIPEALQHYRKAVSYDPSDGKVFYRLGMLVQVHEGDHREALKLLRSAVEKSPDNIQYRMSLADLYYEMNMGLNARREYEAVLKLDPKHAAASKGLKKAR